MLQAAVLAACAVPLFAGSRGVWLGPSWLKGVHVDPVDLDSHFRYLSGLFLGVGFAFLSCVPDIDRKGQRFRLLGSLVVLGGLARMWSLASVGFPSGGHMFGLGMELGVVPVLMLWQWRVARYSAYSAR